MIGIELAVDDGVVALVLTFAIGAATLVIGVELTFEVGADVLTIDVAFEIGVDALVIGVDLPFFFSGAGDGLVGAEVAVDSRRYEYTFVNVAESSESTSTVTIVLRLPYTRIIVVSKGERQR